MSVTLRRRDGAGSPCHHHEPHPFRRQRHGQLLQRLLTVAVVTRDSTPTDIALSTTSVAENAGANATVGTLSTTDPDAGNTFTYTLVAGTGSADNGSFNISGNDPARQRLVQLRGRQLVLRPRPDHRPGRPVLRGGLHDHGHERQRDADRHRPVDQHRRRERRRQRHRRHPVHDRSRRRQHLHLHPRRGHRLGRQRRVQHLGQRPCGPTPRSTSRSTARTPSASGPPTRAACPSKRRSRSRSRTSTRRRVSPSSLPIRYR